MKNLPQRPRQHVLENESRIFTKQILPTEWIVEDGQNDYGIDLVVEIVKDSCVTGAHFLMQLKSTDKLAVSKDGYIIHPCSTSTLQYFLERPELVIYLVYDSKSKVGYWIWIQDFLRSQPSSSWKKQETLTVKIPKNNRFTKDTNKQIEIRVLRLHKKEKLINTFQSLDNPLFKYNLEFDRNAITVNVLPKYPGTDKDVPILVDLKFNLDDTNEGKKALADWENVIKRGIGAKINSRFIKSVTMSDIFNPEMVFGDKFKLDQLEIEPIKRDIKFSAKVEVLDKENNIIAQLPYIEFKEIRYGTDEALLSNEEQEFPFRFSILFNFVEKSSTFSYKLKSKKANAFEMKEAFLFQKALSDGHWLQLVNLKTGDVVIKYPILERPVFIPSAKMIAIAEKLALIQQKMKTTFVWPNKITSDDLSMIEKVVNIINTGYSLEGNKFGYEFDKATVQELADRHHKNKLAELVFDSQNRVLLLFNQKFMFGPIKIYLPNPKPTKKTLERFRLLDTLSDNAKIRINLDIDEPGIIIQYLNWLPEKT